MGKILWLASYPKSGNTWLRAFLHNFLRNPNEPFDINELNKFSTSDSALRRYRLLDKRPVSQWSKEDVASMRPRTHEALTHLFPDHVIVKTHNALVVDRGSPMISMEHTAAAIYVIRNPLDVVISYADHNGQTIDQTLARMGREDEIDTSEKHVYEYRGSWSSHVKSWTQRPHDGLHVMRYEDALQKPTETFGAVAKFLGVDPPVERLERAIKFASFDTLRDQEEADGFNERWKNQERFFRAGKSDQWRGILSPAQIRRICRQHNEQMARFGYLPNDL